MAGHTDAPDREQLHCLTDLVVSDKAFDLGPVIQQYGLDLGSGTFKEFQTAHLEFLLRLFVFSITP